MTFCSTYYAPDAMEDVLGLLAEHQRGARLIAGGTDLLLEIERGLRPGVEALIDLSAVPGMRTVNADGGWVRMGPLVTHAECAASKLVRTHALALARACWEVGAPQIRNRATVAGNLVTASPANDSITPLVALDATVTLKSVRGERTMPLTEFHIGPRLTVLEPDEILTEIAFPVPAPGTRSAFYKLGLRHAQAISLVSAAAVLAIGGDGLIEHASVALGAVAPTIIRATGAEAALLGQALSADVIDSAAASVRNAVAPISDLRGSEVYRREMAGRCTRRLLRTLAAGAEADGFPDEPVQLGGSAFRGSPGRVDGRISHTEGSTIRTVVNGRSYEAPSGHGKSLLRFLREDLKLIGTKEGCAEGECGACTVLLDGAAVMSCLVNAPRAHGADIVTIEGLSHDDGGLHPLQQAFIETGAVQCGYCTPGFLMSGAKLLEERPAATRTAVQEAITGNLCRCTGYLSILAAFDRACELSGGNNHGH